MASTTNASLRTASKQAAHDARHLAIDAEDYKPDETATSFGSITEEDIPALQKAWGEHLLASAIPIKKKALKRPKSLPKVCLTQLTAIKLVFQCCSSQH
jgi:hypothetical protein